jgi:hypothetical protein
LNGRRKTTLEHLKNQAGVSLETECAREALIKASLPNFNFYWLGKWPPREKQPPSLMKR